MTSTLAEQYSENGFLHVDGVFGEDEIAGALRAVAPLPEWARSRSGDPDIQRVQPLQSCAAVADPGWIGSFYDNPRLDRIVSEVFGDAIAPAPSMARDPHLTALLIDPLERWWSTGLHRDYRDFLPDLDLAAWRARAGDPRYFNQINIPLLPDTSFWLIPGSHRREDTEAEARLVGARGRHRRGQSAAGDPERVESLRSALIEDLGACGAVNLVAAPGDLVVYRSNMLHCGMYEPGVPRLTLHDAVYSPQWHEYAMAVASGRMRRPLGAAARVHSTA